MAKRYVIMLGEGQLPEQKQTFQSGANYDQSPEKIFANPNSGLFLDAHNMQPTSNDGNTGDLEKIKGEQLYFPNTRSDTGYECAASATVNGVMVEVWVPTNPSFPRIIRADGIVVLSSEDLPFSIDYPLQWDVNNSDANGEISITDKQPGNAPYVFNIQDMQDNLATDKYFSAFDPLLYQVNIQSALDIPVFVEVINVGGGGGKPVGKYLYAIRYASQSGDVTQWSQSTPPIPIGQSLNSQSDQYPWVQTFGGPPNPQALTAFAPKIRFRVTNQYNYDYIEIKCTSYNQGAGIEYTSNGVIVARVNIAAGEISTREYVDPQESNVNIPLSAQNESRQLAHIDNAGSVKYYDRRLNFADVTLASKQSDLQFLEINEKQGFPVIDKLYKEGYNDPYNMVYKTSNLRGETYGYGAVCYDCVGNTGWVDKASDLKSYTFPNRRDQISSETANYSLNGTVKAALTSTNAVGQCHEVFDLGDRIFKSDACSFKNIIEKGRITGSTGTKLVPTVKEDCDETNSEIENHGANVNGISVSVSYQPFTPVRQTDTNVEGHNYVVNTKVSKSLVILGGVTEGDKAYRPAGFAPDYYAMGMCMPGVTNFPPWAKAFSIVRTPPAKRIVAQGLGYYSLIKGKFKLIGDQNLGGKESRKFWFYSPDIENGIVASDTVNDIIDNPQNYKLQFVSPLGFFSEWYSAEDKFLINSQKDRCIDMISYVRMLADNTGPDSNVNPMEDPDMGIDGGDGNRYIAYEKFRNLTVIPSMFSSDPAGGNKLFGISTISRKSVGRGTYLEIEADQDVYASVFTGGMSDSNFENSGLQNWTEPVYMINIIRTGAQVPDVENQGYLQTTHYQKLESIIGKSTGAANQSFILVDERWEDCIPAPKSTQFGAGIDRYIFIKLPNGTVQRWINVTYKSSIGRASVDADIAAGVNDVYGTYTHTNIDNRDRFFTINFDLGYIPPAGSLILVRYDNTAPIRVFGGDGFIGETIFAPIDGQASARDDEAETQFALGIGLPYKFFKINPRYYTIRKAGAGINEIQDSEWFSIGFIRQLCAMFTVESRVCTPLAHNSEYPNQFFPLINYVIRPNRWGPDQSYSDNSVFDDYPGDYGDAEKANWKWGGFRFLQQINPDYSVQPPIAFFSKPTIGFEEQLSYPTRTMWSLPRAINVQNAPSIKTFPANNSFDIDDNQGNIQYLWVDVTSAGENIYAVTQSGICMLLTKKSILSELNSDQLGVVGKDSFIGGQYWLSRDIGIPDKMWRGLAEAYVPMTIEGGAEVTKRALFFPNRKSVYRLMNNQIVDIGAINYYTRLYPDGISKIAPGLGTKMAAVFDNYKKQYYLYLNGGSVDTTFVFSQKNNMWFGTNGFKFDKFTAYEKKTYGHRDMKTYLLNVGDEMNGEDIECFTLIGFCPDSDKDKEFVSIKVNSNNKPVDIKLYKEKTGATQYVIDEATFGPLYLKNYRGYKAPVGRILASVNSNRPRLQGRLLICRIFHNLAEEFVVTDVTIQYKQLL